MGTGFDLHPYYRFPLLYDKMLSCIAYSKTVKYYNHNYNYIHYYNQFAIKSNPFFRHYPTNITQQDSKSKFKQLYQFFHVCRSNALQ